MTNIDKELEDFLRRYTDIQPVPGPKKPARQIMVSGLPTSLGPRLDMGRNGRQRWVTRLDRKADLRRGPTSYPMV